MGIEGGNIVRKIGGESIKRAKESITLTANGGNLTFNARKKVTMVGRNGGVQYLNDYTPPPPLRVVKLDGPFDEKGQKVSCIKKGISYQYKIVNFNRQPKLHELIRIKWATQFDEGEIISKYPQNNGKQEVKFWVPRDVKNSKFSVYAYLEKPSKDVSILSRLDDKFYYKGTKKWGQLQSGFATKNSKVTEKELNIHLDEIGKANVKILKALSFADTNIGKSIIELIYEYGAGTRQVLSNDDDIENKVVDNFYTFKYGKKLSFNEKSIQSKKLHSYQPFQEYFKNYLEVVKILLKEKTVYQKNGKEIANIFLRDLNLSDFKPNFSITTDIYSHDYYGFMGGTQTIKVDLEISEMEKNKYKVKTKMCIGDWYGADWDDINGGNLSDFLKEIKIDPIKDLSNPSDLIKRIQRAGKEYMRLKGNVPSLNAFFWLQHYYGYYPYETEIIYEDTNYIQL